MSNSKFSHLVTLLANRGISVSYDTSLEYAGLCHYTLESCEIILRKECYQTLVHESMHAVQWLWARSLFSSVKILPLGFKPADVFIKDICLTGYTPDRWAIESEAFSAEINLSVEQCIFRFLAGDECAFKSVKTEEPALYKQAEYYDKFVKLNRFNFSQVCKCLRLQSKWSLVSSQNYQYRYKSERGVTVIYNEDHGKFYLYNADRKNMYEAKGDVAYFLYQIVKG